MCDKKSCSASAQIKVFPPQNQIKELFQQWCDVTTCAGVIDFSLSRALLGKIFWLTVLLGFLYLTGIQTRNAVNDFLYGKEYQTSLTEIIGSAALFPNVTVCNYNRIKKTPEYNLSKHALSYAFSATVLDYFTYFNQDLFSRLAEFEKDYNEMKKMYQLKNIRELFQKFGYTCEETFVSCQWNGIPFKCCEMATELVGAEGRCWNLLYRPVNETERLRQHFQGSNYGLKLLINPNLDTNYDEVVVNNFLEHGIMIQASYYEQIMLVEAMSLAPGTRAWVELSASSYEFKLSQNPLRKMPCRFNATLRYDKVPYTVDNCFLDCCHHVMFQKVGCVPLGPVREQYPVCEPKQVFNFQLMYNEESRS